MGMNEFVRSAKVRTRATELVRLVTKIMLLETDAVYVARINLVYNTPIGAGSVIFADKVLCDRCLWWGLV